MCGRTGENLMSEFEKVLQKNQLTVVRILSSNHRKGRVTAICRDKRGREVFVKYNLPDMPGNVPFSNEKVIYDKMRDKYVLKHYSKDELLVLEKIDNADTARSILMEALQGNDVKCQENFITSILENYKGLCLGLDQINIEDLNLKKYTFRQYLFKFLGKSWLSGPEIQPINTLPIFKNRVFRYFFILYDIVITLTKKKQKYICHGDPHLNNFLLTENGPVCIDFEDVCLGFREVETAYIVGQIEALFWGNTNEAAMKQILKREEKSIIKAVNGNYKLYNAIKKSISKGMICNPRYLNSDNEGFVNE